MIEYLKVFEIDPDLGVISQESRTMKSFNRKVDHFFKKHILNSVTNTNSKSARFRSSKSEIYSSCLECFSKDKFDEAARSIADILKDSMHYSVKNSFLLIILNYQFDRDIPELNSEGKEEILAIMKMEMNEGIQMNDNKFQIQPNMLPDLGNNLQKCSFIYKSRAMMFEENNIDDGFHLRILDKQDKTISNYFISLMNSVLVADDEVMSRLAQRFIRKKARAYTDSEASFEKVEKRINIIMSQRKKTSVRSIITEIYPYFSTEILAKKGDDEDSITEDTFELMLQSNPSAVSSFISQPTDGKKYMLSNDNRSIWVSIEQGLIDEKTVKVDENSSSRSIKLEIPKKMVKIKR